MAWPPSEQTQPISDLSHGLALHQQGRLAEAARAYQAIPRDHPAYADALNFLGVIALQQGQPARAVELIGAAIALRPHHAGAHNNLGNALRELGRPDEALAEYDRAIALNPAHAEAFDNRGNALRDLGRFEAALASHDRAITLKPTAAGAHHNRGNALRDLGRLDDALISYDRAIALDPRQARTWHSRGVALADLGRHADALTSFDRTLALHPDHAEAWRDRGDVLRALGRLDAAVASYDQSIALRPDAADTHHNRGAALAALHQYEAATASYDRAIALRPDHAEAHNNRGTAQLELGRPEAAIADFDRAIAVRPDLAEAHNNRGDASRHLGRLDAALASHDRAIALKPNHAGAHNNRGTALTLLGRPEEALASFDRAIALRPDHAEAHNNRGGVLRELGRPDEAADSYAKAITLRPDLAAAHAGLGFVHQEMGRIDAARACFKTAISLQPRHPGHYLALVRVTRLPSNSPYVRAMIALADDIAAFNDTDRIDLHFALGQALRDAGDHARAFAHQREGNALKRRMVVYDEATALDRFERIRAIFSEDFTRRRIAGAEASAAPIFIVGMPRSGSTLVEQILASHPVVFGAGEVDALTASGQEIGLFTSVRPFPESVPEWTDDQLLALGRGYVDRMRATAARHASRRPIARITEKTLANLAYVGLIRMVLPNARIIHTTRDPIDTCLSCFSILFKMTEFSYDLPELGRRHAAVSRLMAHWRSILPPGVMLEVQYEKLVEDFAGESRRLIAHCGLEWDDACARFHETERPVRTASAAQVRRPLYRDSIARWRPDPETLRPLLEALDPTSP